MLVLTRVNQISIYTQFTFLDCLLSCFSISARVNVLRLSLLRYFFDPWDACHGCLDHIPQAGNYSPIQAVTVDLNSVASGPRKDAILFQVAETP
jgi:hypothetical protein